MSLACLVMGAALLGTSLQDPAPKISFTKTVIDRRFLSEGVAVGDIDRDGKLDIVAGNVWFRAPDWKPNLIAPVMDIDPAKGYSNCFHNWLADLNGDDWLDQIVIGMPGEKATWRENPRGSSEPWKEHLIWRSAGNESPLYEDLFGNGKKVLIMGTDDEYLAWFEPTADPNAEWICHRISALKGAGSQRYSHGLGYGDLDGDGRNEVLTTGGYYTAPKGEWSFVEADLGPECAHMLPFGGEKRKSILTTSAHRRGVWQFDPVEGGAYQRKVIDETVGQTHAAVLTGLGKGKALNLITGKRKWAHFPGVDVGSEEPAWLVRYELQDGKWVRHVIDEDSGVGTQFVVQDIDGDGSADIVVSNKNGVFFFGGR